MRGPKSRHLSESVHDFVDTSAWRLFYDGVSYDTIIRNGRWFDGTGAASAVRNVGIRAWRACDEYVEALERLPLGPNLAAFIGHSDMRNPASLDERLDAYAEDAVAQYGGLSRMVNRNQETVKAVFVGGRAVFLDGEATALVGRRRTGRFLRAAHKAAAIPAQKGELSSVS